MSMDSRQAQVIRVAKALGDPTRFRILQAIAAREEISCQELTSQLPLAQATVSHHLKVLSSAGLVEARREGAFHFYRALPEALAAHAEALGAAFPPARRRRAAPRPARRRAS